MSDSCVYVTDKEFGWLPANVVSQDETKATVKVFDSEGKNLLGERQVMLKDYPNQALPLQNVDASGNLMQMPDMVDLPSLHEVSKARKRRASFLSLLVLANGMSLTLDGNSPHIGLQIRKQKGCYSVQFKSTSPDASTLHQSG